MMFAGGTSSGAVAGCGVNVGVDVEGEVDVGAVGDCAGAGSGDAPDAVDAGQHWPPGVGLAPSAHLGPRLPGNARRRKSSELVDVGATLSKGTKGGAKNGAQRLEPKREGPEASIRGGIIHQRPVELAGFLLVVLLELGLAVLDRRHVTRPLVCGAIQSGRKGDRLELTSAAPRSGVPVLEVRDDGGRPGSVGLGELRGDVGYI